MSVVVLLGYALGVGLGVISSRISAFGRVWPRIVRTQLLLVEVVLSITSVWSITSIDTVLWPLLLALGLVLMYLVARVTASGPDARPRAALQAWASGTNTGFFVIPVATMLAGPAGAVAGVLMHRMSTPLFAWWTHELRRGAPIRQRRRTSFIDQSPLIAIGVGLLLRLTGPAPDWALTVTLIAAPVLAISGAAVFTGSVLHPTQRIDPRPGVRRWLALSAVRMALLGALAILAPTTPLTIVSVLAALSIPVFGASQMSTVYGYASPVVAAGARYGWFIGGVGLVAAWLVVVA